MIESLDNLIYPEFEQRADAFIQVVEEEIKETKKRNPADYLEMGIEKSLEAWMRRYDALSEIPGEDFFGSLSPTPNQLSNQLDINSASECKVTIHGTSDRNVLLTSLVAKIKGIAKNHQALPSTGIPLISTDDEVNGIRSEYYEGVGCMHNTYLTFTFMAK